MTSLGTGKMSTPGKFTGVGTIVLAIVFLVALVFAANNSTVLGWVIAAIAFGWLALSTVVYIGVHKAAAFGARQVALAQAQMAQHNSEREMKLEHSFKIISVQVGVVNEYLGKDDQMVARALETIEITATNGRGMINPNWEAQEAKMDAAMAKKNAGREAASGTATAGTAAAGAAAPASGTTAAPKAAPGTGPDEEPVSGVIID